MRETRDGSRAISRRVLLGISWAPWPAHSASWMALRVAASTRSWLKIRFATIGRSPSDRAAKLWLMRSRFEPSAGDCGKPRRSHASPGCGCVYIMRFTTAFPASCRSATRSMPPAITQLTVTGLGRPQVPLQYQASTADASTAGKYSNPAGQHRPHPAGASLRPAPTTEIDRHATRSHRGDRQSAPCSGEPRLCSRADWYGCRVSSSMCGCPGSRTGRLPAARLSPLWPQPAAPAGRVHRPW